MNRHRGPDPAGSRFRALRLARRFRHALHALDPSQPAEATRSGMTLREVMDLHGTASLGSSLLFWSLFSQLPVGGVGNVAGVALGWVAWAWWRDAPLETDSKRVMGLQMNLAWTRRLLRLLALGYRKAGLWLRPRWMGWHAPWTRTWWAVWIALQALLIFLPVPMGNVLPGLSLMALGMGRLVQDGVMHLASLGLGLAAMAYTAWLADITWELMVLAWSWLLP